MLETALYECPYCGEEVETTVDLSAGDQTAQNGLTHIPAADKANFLLHHRSPLLILS